DYLALNPQGLVPALTDGDAVLAQSLAILEYLDERWPEPPLLPAAPVERARVRALAQAVACDIHPLNNLRVLKYLARDLGLDEAKRLTWYRHWIATGLAALEALTTGHPATATYCHGERPTMADICLVPQIFNAKRYDCPLDAYPTLTRIFDTCMALPAFDKAQPAKQPDWVE
ncbi:MAG: maleylacetoacetate isomerase, partial [Kiloniellales bacterium]